jgi:hypothetical protein
MSFDRSEHERLTATGRAHARLMEYEEVGRKHGMLPRRHRRGVTWWLGWLFIAAVMLGLGYWLVSLG